MKFVTGLALVVQLYYNKLILEILTRLVLIEMNVCETPYLLEVILSVVL